MIRLWKLGDASKGEYPTQKGADKLVKILEKCREGELTDIIWDSAISVTVIKDDGTIETEDAPSFDLLETDDGRVETEDVSSFDFLESESGHDKVLKEVKEERDYQDSRWGVISDDENTPIHWVNYISSYLGKTFRGKSNVMSSEFRSNMIRVAALAVAAVEAHDRNEIVIKEVLDRTHGKKSDS